MMQRRLFEDEDMPTYLLTIREGSAEALMNGLKSHEFRRKFDSYGEKARVFLYVTRPVGKIIGEVVFKTPIVGSVDSLCSLLADNKYDTEEKVRAYLKNCEVAYALPVLDSRRFENPISLEEIREDIPGFHPPISYIKLDNQKYHSVRNYLIGRE